MNLGKTTKSISLVLISSGLVFAGWGVPVWLSDAPDKQAASSSGSHGSGRVGGGRSFFWFTNSGSSYRGTGTGTGGSHPTRSPSVRGGFGSSASGAGAS
jgi:hypothetical protein